MTIGEQIRIFREKSHLKQKDLAELTGYSRNSIINWERGYRSPTTEVLNKLASVLGVPVAYLMGQGEESVTDTKKEPADPKTDGRNDPFFNSNARLAPEAKDTIDVPVYSREATACCGEGIGVMDITSEPAEFERISHSELRAYDDRRPPFAIYADGDCLESDRIRAGDKIIVNPAEEPAYGAIALVSLYGKLNLKRVYRLPTGEVILKSDDGERRLSPEEQETANFAVLGVMVANHSGRPKPRSL
ncbi:LexA family transcriptional regulator [Pyramidobacter sp.]|uniref:LexA family transcriptional regulator n=1 Tax=Pyramidobacter sp. TaxID=1943581 RepID=UPI0025DEF3DA|nr:LexA family transcriptional regulator [Pyramidobacter sp.]MDY3213390.1 LexA family transcriptional regulator [Pyramidobacter sp.]